MASSTQEHAHEHKRGPRTHHWLLTLVVVVAVVFAARWWLQHRAAVPAPAAAQPVQTLLAQDKGKLATLLDKARVALSQGHIISPPGDNALEYYRQALAIDPANKEVKDGLGKVTGELSTRLDDFLKSGKVDEAEQAIASLKQTIPQDARLAALHLRVLSAQVAKAVSDGKLDQAKDLVEKAKQSGEIAAEQLKKWEADIRAATKTGAAASS